LCNLQVEFYYSKLSGPSQKAIRIGGILYKFPKERVTFICQFRFLIIIYFILQATYSEAKARCEKDGMMLATVEGDEEMKSIIDYLSYVGKFPSNMAD